MNGYSVEYQPLASTCIAPRRLVCDGRPGFTPPGKPAEPGNKNPPTVARWGVDLLQLAQPAPLVRTVSGQKPVDGHNVSRFRLLQTVYHDVRT
jgi:hypothetical protein